MIRTNFLVLVFCFISSCKESSEEGKLYGAGEQVYKVAHFNFANLSFPEYLFDPPENAMNFPVIYHNRRSYLNIRIDTARNFLVFNDTVPKDSLYGRIYYFFTANRYRNDSDLQTPNYEHVDVSICDEHIVNLEEWLLKENHPKHMEKELDKWYVLKWFCDQFPGKSFKMIRGGAFFHIETFPQTVYGDYIELLGIIKQVINDLRNEAAQELEWPNFNDLDPNEELDLKRIKILRNLVPEIYYETLIKE